MKTVHSPAFRLNECVPAILLNEQKKTDRYDFLLPAVLLTLQGL
jgi:hypothetical protein